MTKTLTHEVDSSDVISLLENLDKTKEGIHYFDSGFRGKGKDGFGGTSESPQTVADYVKEHYPISIGKHKIKTNKEYVHNHKIELLNKYKYKLKIKFRD